MAEISTQGNNRQGRRSLRNRNPIKIDFTPMVDLGFLLITFFMLTTTLNKYTVMPLANPVEGPHGKLPATAALTVILSGENKIYYYSGELGTSLESTDFSNQGIRKILLRYNRDAVNQLERLERMRETGQITDNQFTTQRHEISDNALMVMIKSDEHSRYANLIDMLDEINITRVQRYAVMDLEEEEKMLMSGK